tara:strand:- start:478 stop:951 length:474 start_codon:yes stop_codon:yes gene_type:complete
MTLPINPKNFRNPNFKDLKDFLIGILALGLISPLVFIFIVFGKYIFSEKDPNQIIRAEKEEKIVKEIAENYNLKIKEGFFESKYSRNIRLANEVIKIKLKETDISYEEYMSSLKGLDFYYSQKSLDPQFKNLTKLIFMNRHGYYHDAVCDIRYCPPK